MSVEFTVTDLATVAGCGAVTLLILQLLVKPFLCAVFGDAPGTISASPYYKWRPVILNLLAFTVSVVLAFLAQAVGITYETGLQAFLTGLGGGAVAIGGYEGLKNTALAFGLR